MARRNSVPLPGINKPVSSSGLLDRLFERWRSSRTDAIDAGTVRGAWQAYAPTRGLSVHDVRAEEAFYAGVAWLLQRSVWDEKDEVVNRSMRALQEEVAMFHERLAEDENGDP